MSRAARKCPISYVSAAVAVVRLGNAPRKKGKASRPVVSYRCKVKECTPEEGKSKSPSGELLLQSQGMHPRKEEKASHSEVSCRYEIRECTPEKEKSKSPRGEPPLQDKESHSGRRRKQVIQRCLPPRIRKRPLAPGSAAGRYRQ